MSNFGRTKENKKRLRLKAFFRRILCAKVIPSKGDCVVRRTEPVLVGSGSYGYKSIDIMKSIGSGAGKFQYRLQKVLKNSFGVKHEFVTGFNKPALIGKIVVISGEHYRVISKV